MKKKNVIVFMADHYRFDMAPPFSQGTQSNCFDKVENRVITPNLDQFFCNASAFTNCYTVSPHCCPSRASFFSGLYPSQHNVWNNILVDNALSIELFDNTRLFSQELKDVGYSLYFSGKWHVSLTHSPEDYGFEYCSTTKDVVRKYQNKPKVGDWDAYNKINTICGDGVIRKRGFSDYKLYGESENPFGDEDVVNQALKKIRDVGKKNPFFLFTGVLGPHDPYQVPQRFLEQYPIDNIIIPESYYDSMSDKPALYRRTREQFAGLTDEEVKQTIRHYLAFCSYEDYLFGKLISCIKEENLYDDTIFIFTSDHGDYLGEHGLFTKGLPCFNSAYRIPLMIGGGGMKKQLINQHVSIIDIAETICDFAGTKMKNSAGKSLSSYIYGSFEQSDRDVFFQTNGNEIYGIQRAVISGKWKYVYNSYDYDELYDLENDYYQQSNLLVSNRCCEDIVFKMWKKLWRFFREANDNCVNSYITTALHRYGYGIMEDEE